MLEFKHIIIIAVVSIICGFIFFRKKIINTKKENFTSDNINYHHGNDYNVVSYNYDLNEENNDNQDNNQDD